VADMHDAIVPDPVASQTAILRFAVSLSEAVFVYLAERVDSQHVSWLRELGMAKFIRCLLGKVRMFQRANSYTDVFLAV
jgi:hypothetical protein